MAMIRTLALAAMLAVLGGCANRPPSPDANALAPLLQEADNAFQAGAWEQARATYREVIARDDDNAQALFRLGVLAYREGNAQEAEDYFRQARVATGGKHPQATYNLGVLHLRRAFELLGAYEALVAAPDSPAHADQNRLQALRAVRKAIERFRRSGATGP
jgi:tetratricopeptide (TPR) repeat protein